MPEKITLLVVCRHEEAALEAFFARHASHVDEIVFVHDGECLDDSSKIARLFTQQVHERPGEHNPFPHREWALRNCIEDGWVLVLDPDERASDEMLAQLRPLVEKAEADGCDGIAFVMRPVLDGVVLRHHPGQYRLFKHSARVHYPSHPHAGIEGLTKTMRTNLVFENRNRAESIPGKRRRFNAHLKRFLREHPDSPRRVAWEAGLKMDPEIVAILDEKGISLEVEGQPLLEVKGIGEATAQRLAELGIETLEELFRADAGYLARGLGTYEKRVRKWQEEAGKLAGFADVLERNTEALTELMSGEDVPKDGKC